MQMQKHQRPIGKIWMCMAWFLFMGRWSPDLSIMTKSKIIHLKKFCIHFKTMKGFFFFSNVKRGKMKEQSEITRFRNKKSLGLCLPHGTWALNLGPSSSHCGTPNLKNNNIYYTPRAWFLSNCVISWDLLNWALAHSVKSP